MYYEKVNQSWENLSSLNVFLFNLQWLWEIECETIKYKTIYYCKKKPKIKLCSTEKCHHKHQLNSEYKLELLSVSELRHLWKQFL